MSHSERVIDLLLVEDDPNDEELTLHALRVSHLSNPIGVVRDGAEALDYLFQQGEYSDRPDGNPKLILLDLKLPKISGLEVLRRLREAPATKNIPVTVLTSSNQDRDVEECYRLGVNSYIVKPVDFEQFVKAVQQLGFYWLLLNYPPPAWSNP